MIGDAQQLPIDFDRTQLANGSEGIAQDIDGGDPSHERRRKSHQKQSRVAIAWGMSAYAALLTRPLLTCRKAEAARQTVGGLINPVIEWRPHAQPERWQGNQRAGLIMAGYSEIR